MNTAKRIDQNRKNRYKDSMKKYILGVFLLSPMSVFAQTGTSLVGNTVAQVSAIVAQLVPLLVSIAVLLFLWGIVKFIAKIGDEEGRKAGKSLMIWGMVGLFVMISFWGIIGYVQQSLGLVGQPIITGGAPVVPNPIPMMGQ